MWPKHEIVTPQAVNHPTFVSPPPLTGMTYPEALDHNLDHNGDHPHYVYADTQTHSPVYVTWRESVRAAWRVSHIAQKAAQTLPSGAPANAQPKFALVAAADNISYLTVADGVLRGGYECFLVSFRMSAPTVAQMLQAQGTTHVIASRDPAMQSLVAGVKEILGADKLEVLQMPLFEEIYTNEDVERPAKFVPDLDDTGIVLHSSGSTSTPKRVPYPFRTLNEMSIYTSHTHMDHCGYVIGYHVLPMFHLMGVGAMAAATWSGSISSVYPPQFPPMAPTPDTALSHLVYTKANAVVYPPIILHALMAMKPVETVEVLKKLVSVAYGGGPLNRSVGDALAKQGVKLGNLYGMTEVLCIANFLPTPIDGEDWDWVHVHKAHRIHYRDLGHETYEPIFMESEWHRNNINNCEIDGVKGYASNDVVRRHPTLPNSLRVIGRVDDQIVLSTGEKTNPTPLEHILLTDKHIGQVITFGRGRPHGGIIIQPKPAFAFDGRDKEKLSAFRELIAPTVAKVNDYAPTHSRLMTEMILVTSPDRPFIMTQKGTPLRSDATSKYEADINAAYEAFELSAESKFTPPTEWTAETTQEFVREIVHKVITSHPGPEDDVFQHGCDSLRAAWVRNAIANTLPEAQSSQITREVLYEYPTISRLAAHLLVIVSGGSKVAKSKTEELNELVEKYTESFPTHTGTVPFPTDKKTLIVTGTTGGLGSHLLERLLLDPSVERVYAINRASAGRTESLETIHAGVFKERGLDEQALSEGIASGRVKFVVANTAATKLGVSDELYEELRNVTHILHNAWPVNFNYAIATFEPAVKGVKELVDLSLLSNFDKPPKFLFVSSVAVTRNAKGASTPEAYFDNADTAAGLGYGEGKWVSETILSRASGKTPLRPVSVRVGQLSGGANGNWNASDWVPTIVRSAKGLNSIPVVPGHGSITWVRLDEASAILLEMIENATAPVLHLVHPKPASWTTLFGAFGKALDVPLVEFDVWYSALQKKQTEGSVIDAKEIPAIKLVSFFGAVGGAGGQGIEGFTGLSSLGTAEAEKSSATLREMKSLTAEDADSWVAYWRSAGFL